MYLLLIDVLGGLLSRDGPDTVDMGACFGCRGNVFTGRWLAMDVFFGPAILAFSHQVTT
jgi:hypothetical protein